MCTDLRDLSALVDVFDDPRDERPDEGIAEEAEVGVLEPGGVHGNGLADVRRDLVHVRRLVVRRR
jgi:hypothetical protein